MSKVMAQGDVTFMGKTVESLVVEFDQAKYEEFLSSGSKSPRVARQYRRVSSEIRSQVPLETFPKMACANSIIYGHVARVALVNVSHGLARPTSLKANLATPLLFLNSRLPGVPNNP